MVSHAANLQLQTYVNAQISAWLFVGLVQSCWSFPPAGCFKINVDSAFRAASQLRGVGAVLCDDVGSYAGGFVRRFTHVNNLYMVELMATREGIFWAIQRNVQRIILENDSLQVV